MKYNYLFVLIFAILGGVLQYQYGWVAWALGTTMAFAGMRYSSKL